MMERVLLLYLLCLNSIVCGLEFCASAAFTYIPPLLLKEGLREEQMSVMLGLGPLLGFFLVPPLGRASDRCKSYYGRRRPFILGLSVLVLISLILIPQVHFVSSYISQTPDMVSKVILVLGCILLDFSVQACLTPCEALLSDCTLGTPQHEKAFTVYSFMVSLGGCIGYLITAIDWTDGAVGNLMGTQEQSAFTILVFLFSFTVLLTFSIAKEQPLAPSHDAWVAPAAPVALQMPDPGCESGSEEVAAVQQGQEIDHRMGKKEAMSARVASSLKSLLSQVRQISVSQMFLNFVCSRLFAALPESIRTLFSSPYPLRSLAAANFASWTAIMAFNLFFTDFVGQEVYGGNPNAPDDATDRDLYDEGVRAGSWGLLFHCITSAIYAIFIDRVIDRFGMRLTYFFGMLSFSMVMLMMSFCQSIYLVNFLAGCTGFAYATITTIPYMLLTKYHENKEIYFGRLSAPRGMATDMATLDSVYFLSQVLLSACMGYVVWLSGTVLSYVISSGMFGVIASAISLSVVDSKFQLYNLPQYK